MTPRPEEENLDLVAVDAEMIRTILRTQGEIIGSLQNINAVLLGLTKTIGFMADSIERLCETNAELTEALKNYTLATMEEEQNADSDCQDKQRRKGSRSCKGKL